MSTMMESQEGKGQAIPVSKLVASILESSVKSAKDVFSKHRFTQQQLEEFIQEAKNGNVTALYIVGYMYNRGKGVTANKQKAAEFYLMAADKGHMVAQFNIGRYYEKGRGLQQDNTKSFEYYRMSADQGYAKSQYNTGNNYKNGLGVSQNYQKAIEYYHMAIAQGYTRAKTNLGWLYNKGKGVIDYQKAMEYYLQAAQDGSALAYHNIGKLYEKARGVPQNYTKALEYYQIAAEKGYPKSKSSVERLKAIMLKSVEDWTVDDVVAWIASLNLSKSYQGLLQENHVNGKVLATMKTKGDWQELGVTSFGDLRLLVNTISTSANFNPAPTPSAVPVSAAVSAPVPRITPVATRHSTNGRFTQNGGLDDVVYKPAINLMQGEFKPLQTCNEHMLNDLPTVLLAVRNVSAIVKECVLVSESRLQHLPSHVPTLSADEALAIAAYSYDLGVVDAEVNLYHSLNTILRKRDPKKMERLKPFLFYLMSGLSKLPPLQTTVYRGIPFSSMQMIQDNYRLGLSVHWSGFTSASTDIESAQVFAQESGIIFRIKVLTGRSIKHYSSIPSEDEVLLSPNIKLLVTSGVQLESDGFYYLDLVEQLDGPAFIF